MAKTSAIFRHFWRIASAVLIFVQIFSFFVFPRSVFAASPANVLSYQGRLLNSGRVPVSDATASVVFELYSASSGGTCLWSNSSATCASATARSVTLTDGLFSENLGDILSSYAAISDTVFGDDASVFLQVTVNGETLAPRKQIFSAPYAMNAHLLNGLNSDNDGSTTAAIVALNSTGNLVVTGDPSVSGVSGGSVYINPTAGNVGADNTLLGIAVDGSSRFRVDAEGDAELAGEFVVNGGSISTTVGTMNLFDDLRGNTRIDLGGVDTNIANTIRIATDATSADTISIGNANSSTTLALTGGSAWSISTLGAATFSSGIDCSDCINWADFSDSSLLDADTATALGLFNLTYNVSGTGSFHITNTGEILTINPSGAVTYTLGASTNPSYTINDHGSGDVVTNLLGTGDWTLQDNSSTFFTINDAGSYDYTLDPGDNPTYTITNGGSGNVITNLGGTGDVTFQDSLSTFLTLSDTGAYDFTLDATDNPSYTITDSGSGNVITNLAGTGDFILQDNGSSFFTITDAGAFDFALDATDNPTFTVTNSGTNNVITNLVGTGDFVVQDNGVTYATFSDSGVLSLTDAVAVSSSSRTGNFVTNTTVTGTWSGALGTRNVQSWSLTGDYQASETGVGGTDGVYTGLSVLGQVSSGGDLNSLYGAYVGAANTSVDASAVESSMYGVYGYATNGALGVTIPTMYGVAGNVGATNGTVTTGYAVYGSVTSGSGSFTTAYGGYFENISEGTTRYGVVGNASGGTNNFSGYFTGALVQIDDNTDPIDFPATNTNVSSAGDLFLRDSLEGDGSLYYGDTSGEDDFVFTSSNTTTTAFLLNTTSIASNTAFQVQRSNSVATDFDGILFNLLQNRTSAGSDGIVFNLANFSGGNSPGMYITQDQVGDATTVPNAQAMVIDVNEAANNDEVILIRSDADNSSAVRDTEFRFENDGDAFADGAWTGGGADYAEYFPISQSIPSSALTCWNPSVANGVRQCEAGNTNIVGVISTDPGFIGNGYTGAEASLENNTHYALVGLVGQIETLASADAGAIAIGDPITTSFARAGYGAKASGGTYIIGRALEPLASGTGTIKVLVQPMWYGGEMLSMNGDASFSGDVVLTGETATASNIASDSTGISFVGSSWNGNSANDLSLTLRNDILTNGTSRLALNNDDGVDVMTFGSTGDLALAGNFYPSDRGALQYGAYVYYDSTGAGLMRTNAAGWGANSSSFSESFASTDVLSPGDVVEFSSTDGSVLRSSGELYSNRIAGVVVFRSAFAAGVTSGAYTVAISGRATVQASAENGTIASGDPLTTSSQPGVVMKATTSGQIVGYALAPLAEGSGAIAVFVRPQYYNIASSSPSVGVQSQDVETLNVSSLLSMNGGDIVSVGTLSGIGTWEIQEDGDIVTSGQLTQIVRSLQNENVPTYATTSTQTVVQLSGTSILHGGMARVAFEDVDPYYNDIISPETSYRVLVTPDGITGQLYVTDRSNTGFVIHDTNVGEGVSVDWLVLAYRHDLVPEPIISSDVQDPVADENVSTDDGETVPVENDETVPADDTPSEDTGSTDQSSPDSVPSDSGSDLPPDVPEDTPEIPTDLPSETPPQEAFPENAP